MKHYVLIVEFCEPKWDGPYDTEEERDAAAKEIREAEDFSEDGMVFMLSIEDDTPYLGAYVGGDFDG